MQTKHRGAEILMVFRRALALGETDGPWNELTFQAILTPLCFPQLDSNNRKQGHIIFFFNVQKLMLCLCHLGNLRKEPSCKWVSLECPDSSVNFWLCALAHSIKRVDCVCLGAFRKWQAFPSPSLIWVTEPGINKYSITALFMANYKQFSSLNLCLLVVPH